MFSENAKDQIEACRNCWMCRHVCPVGLATGKEAATPRGRALLLSYILKGFDVEKDAAEDMFACCLCNACADWCETGYEPAVFVREARTNAIVGDFVPEKVKGVVESALETGGLFDGRLSAGLSERLSALPEEGGILLVLGENARYKTPEIALAAIRLCEKTAFSLRAERRTQGRRRGVRFGREVEESRKSPKNSRSGA
jgi:Fe-S oxidoreductase